MRISSIKTVTKKSKYYLKTMFIKSMKDAGALVNAHDITTNS